MAASHRKHCISEQSQPISLVLGDTNAQPLEKCNYVLEMHCLEQSLLRNRNYQLKLEIGEKKVSLSHAVYWNLQSYQPCCFFPFYPKLMKIKAKNHYFCPTYFIGMFKLCENIIPFIKYYPSLITALSNT